MQRNVDALKVDARKAGGGDLRRTCKKASHGMHQKPRQMPNLRIAQGRCFWK
jgi:hypothetical protein